MKSFKVNIITHEKAIYEGEITSLIVPAYLGYLGVWADHAPLMSMLLPGKISLRDKTGESAVIYSKGKGFLEVNQNRATLLLDDAQKP